MHPMDDPSHNDAAASDRELTTCLQRLAAGDLAARDELIAVACERMRHIAHRMLQRFPTVRRWDQTDDIVQNAAMRLYRALGDVAPQSVRHFTGLVAIQIRRELLDLAKKYAGPESHAANHQTNHPRANGEGRAAVDDVSAPTEPTGDMEKWSQLHVAAASLPEDERELFHMVWYLGLKQDHAAQLLECSVRTVKRRWETAKQLIGEAMNGVSPLSH